MNTELFIARKVFFNKENPKGISNKIVAIAVGSISIGLAVIIISVAILIGFKNQIRDKVFGFAAHFQVVNYDGNSSFESIPITVDSTYLAELKKISQISEIYPYATKLGIIKTETDIHEMVLKGVDSTYNWSFFRKHLKEGSLPDFNTPKRNNDIIISKKICNLLNLQVNDKIFCYFWNENDTKPRSVSLTIKGIYETSMEEFDKRFVVGDIRHVQRIYGWHRSEIGGLEILLHDYTQIPKLAEPLRDLGLLYSSEKSMYKTLPVTQKFSFLFDWLVLIDMNVWVLLILMVVVAGINMISGLLIIIIERTRMIGILKALGYPNINIRKVFLYLSGFLSARGMIWGNVIGIGLCIIQYFTGIVSLDPGSYYIDVVPIEFNIAFILLINLGTLISILAMIIIPTMLISRISPVEAIRFE